MGVSKGTRNVIKRIRRKSELLTRLKCIVALSFGKNSATKLVEVVVPCEKDVLEVPAIKSFKNQFKPLEPQERQSRSKTVKTILAAEEFLTKDALAKLKNGNSCLISFEEHEEEEEEEVPTRRETALSPTRNRRDTCRGLKPIPEQKSSSGEPDEGLLQNRAADQAHRKALKQLG